ncbi:hypothetical protein [Streptomyces sp. NPDC051572]|uniref:hypothetical protein n=1 Tax=Streptomyces sp. NPDC051572 TaxID=3155802 RepID=UPI00344D7F00
MPSSSGPGIDTDGLHALIDIETKAVGLLRARIALAALGLVAARIRQEHPEATHFELGYSVNTRTFEGWTGIGRIRLPKGPTGATWRAALAASTRDTIDGWCTHLGPDIEELLPNIWHRDEWTDLKVVDLEGVLTAVGRIVRRT